MNTLMNINYGELNSNVAINKFSYETGMRFIEENKDLDLEQFTTNLANAVNNLENCSTSIKNGTILTTVDFLRKQMKEIPLVDKYGKPNGKVEMKPKYQSKDIAEAYENAGLYSVGYINNLLGVCKAPVLMQAYGNGFSVGVCLALRKVYNDKRNEKDSKNKSNYNRFVLDCIDTLDSTQVDSYNLKKIKDYLNSEQENEQDKEMPFEDCVKLMEEYEKRICEYEQHIREYEDKIVELRNALALNYVYLTNR